MLTQYRVDGGAWRDYRPRTSSCSTAPRHRSRSGRRPAPGQFELLRRLRRDQPVGGLGMLWYPVKPFGDFSLKFQFREGRTDGGCPTAARSSASRTRACRSRSVPTTCAQDGQRGLATRRGSRSTAVTRSRSTTARPASRRRPGRSTTSTRTASARSASRARGGEWNDYEVEVVGQHYTILRNGDVINEFENAPGIELVARRRPADDAAPVRQGYIGLQNHGGADTMQYRNVRVQDLSADAPGRNRPGRSGDGRGAAHGRVPLDRRGRQRRVEAGGRLRDRGDRTGADRRRATRRCRPRSTRRPRSGSAARLPNRRKAVRPLAACGCAWRAPGR